MLSAGDDEASLALNRRTEFVIQGPTRCPGTAFPQRNDDNDGGLAGPNPVPSGGVIESDEDDRSAISGSGLAAERARRQQQVDDLRAAGRQPYPYRFDRTHSAADVRALGADLGPGEDTDTPVSIGGRVMLKRDTGKLVFLTVADRGTRSNCSSPSRSSATSRSPTSRPSIAATGSERRAR